MKVVVGDSTGLNFINLIGCKFYLNKIINKQSEGNVIWILNI